MIWGQTDGILAALVISALYYLHCRKRGLSAVFMLLALNMKLQAIVFVPLWGLMMLASLHKERRWTELPNLLLLTGLIQAAILLPFMFSMDGLVPIWRNVTNAADVFHWISIHAYNMWYWIVPDAEPGNTDQLYVLGTLTYYQIGLITFSIALFITLLPVMKHTIRTFRDRATPDLSRETIWLCAALSNLVFFFLIRGCTSATPTHLSFF